MESMKKCNDDNCLLCDHTGEYCSICIDDNIINMFNKDSNEEDILISINGKYKKFESNRSDDSNNFK